MARKHAGEPASSVIVRVVVVKASASSEARAVLRTVRTDTSTSLASSSNQRVEVMPATGAFGHSSSAPPCWLEHSEPWVKPHA